MQESSTNNSKQAAWIAIGSFFSFIVGIVSPMILSRYFDKGDYGTYKQVMYVYNTLLTVFTLGLPRAYAYFLPKHAIEYSKDIIQKITRIFLVLGGLFSIVLVVCAGWIAEFLNNGDLKYALILFAPTPLFLLPTMGLDGIYASFQKTKQLSIYTIVTRIMTISLTVLPVVIWHGNYVHAIIGFDIASLITCMIALYMKSWPIRGEEHKKSSVTYRQIFRFSLPLLYASLWGMIISSANQFFISRYYGNEVFAEYSNGFMENPVAGMILGAIGAVLLPIFSRIENNGNITKDAVNIWNTAFIKSAKMIFPILVYSICCAEVLMTCMYGNQYINSSIYFQIKNVSSLFYVVPFAPILLAVGKTKEYANVHMLIAFIIVIGEWICVHFMSSPIWIVVVSEVCQVLKIFIMLCIIASLTPSKKLRYLIPIKAIGKILAISLLAGMGAYLSIAFISFNKFILLFVSFFVFVSLYYALCWTMRVTYKDIASSFIPSSSKLWIYRFIP